MGWKVEKGLEFKCLESYFDGKPADHPMDSAAGRPWAHFNLVIVGRNFGNLSKHPLTGSNPLI